MIEGQNYDWLEEFKGLSHEDMKREIFLLGFYLPSPWYRHVANCYVMLGIFGGLFFMALGGLAAATAGTAATEILMVIGGIVLLVTGLLVLETYDWWSKDPVSIVYSKSDTRDLIEGHWDGWTSPVEDKVRKRVKFEAAERVRGGHNTRMHATYVASSKQDNWASKNVQQQLDDLKKQVLSLSSCDIRIGVDDGHNSRARGYIQPF